MASRLVEVSNPSRLTHHGKHLVIQTDGAELGRVPIEDLGILILDSYGIEVEQSLLVACAAHNVAVIICDERHLPASLALSLSAHTLHARILRDQVECGIPTKKRIWQQIVQMKITNQAAALDILKIKPKRLAELSALVRSGDPDNVEGTAANFYWDALMGEEFRRQRGGEDVNAYLNYGYAILRAAVARAIVGTGLHPALGVFHKNQYNPYALADDAMEPFRPLVDLHVVQEFGRGLKDVTLDPQAKRRILQFLEKDMIFAKKRLPILTAIEYFAADIKAMMCDRKKSLGEIRLVNRKSTPR